MNTLPHFTHSKNGCGLCLLHTDWWKLHTSLLTNTFPHILQLKEGAESFLPEFGTFNITHDIFRCCLNAVSEAESLPQRSQLNNGFKLFAPGFSRPIAVGWSTFSLSSVDSWSLFFCCELRRTSTTCLRSRFTITLIWEWRNCLCRNQLSPSGKFIMHLIQLQLCVSASSGSAAISTSSAVASI